MDPDAQDQKNLPTLRAELRERSKELGFLHHATRMINARGEPRDLLRAVLELLPSAMCYPELAGARIGLGPLEIRTPGFERTELSLRAEFDVTGEGTGSVEVCYTGEPPELLRQGGHASARFGCAGSGRALGRCRRCPTPARADQAARAFGPRGARGLPLQTTTTTAPAED